MADPAQNLSNPEKDGRGWVQNMIKQESDDVNKIQITDLYNVMAYSTDQSSYDSEVKRYRDKWRGQGGDSLQELENWNQRFDVDIDFGKEVLKKYGSGISPEEDIDVETAILVSKGVHNFWRAVSTRPDYKELYESNELYQEFLPKILEGRERRRKHGIN